MFYIYRIYLNYTMDVITTTLLSAITFFLGLIVGLLLYSYLHTKATKTILPENEKRVL